MLKSEPQGGTVADNKSFLERRHRSRAPVKIPVEFRMVEDPQQVEAFRGRPGLAKDLSLDGMYIKTEKPVKPGDILRLEITVPENSKQLFAFAEVVRVDPSGAGLRLMLMEQEDHESLQDYLRRASAT